jgi:hypothetical protein
VVEHHDQLVEGKLWRCLFFSVYQPLFVIFLLDEHGRSSSNEGELPKITLLIFGLELLFGPAPILSHYLLLLLLALGFDSGHLSEGVENVADVKVPPSSSSSLRQVECLLWGSVSRLAVCTVVAAAVSLTTTRLVEI